ncbi:hypothetical protein F5Y18DRAFT_432323 [Xylariaceae sp. FL1019]|nr:hypothetical protein F5Y18DRAFT_432323 [Xylariaceae sp. FL1019]
MSSPAQFPDSDNPQSVASSFIDAEIFSTTSHEDRPSTSGSAKSTDVDNHRNTIVRILQDLESFSRGLDIDRRIPEQLRYYLLRPQYDLLLEILHRNPRVRQRDHKSREEHKQGIIQQTFGDSSSIPEQLARCAAWLDRTPWDYEEPYLSIRMTSDIHNDAGNTIRDYILRHFQHALSTANVHGRVAQGDRTMRYKSSQNRAEPDLNFWLAPPFNISELDGSSQSEDETGGITETEQGAEGKMEQNGVGLTDVEEGRAGRQVQSETQHRLATPQEELYPGLIVEVGWSHHTPNEQCAGYIKRANGFVRCVISINAKYVEFEKQPTTPQLPSIVLNAWRYAPCIETDTTVQHFIQDQVIWQYTAEPPSTRHVYKPDGSIKLTLGDLSSTLRHLQGPVISISWRALRRLFCQAYEKHRDCPSSKRRASDQVETDDHREHRMLKAARMAS